MIGIAFAIAMMVFFGHATTWDGGIFAFIRNIIDEKSKISKPIYSCPICMTPWWGTLFYIIIWQWNGWREWIVVIGCASGINVFSVIFIYIKDYVKSRTRGEIDDCCDEQSYPKSDS